MYQIYRTVRRILKKFIDNKTIESVGNTEKTPNKKYKLAEQWQSSGRVKNLNYGALFCNQY